MELTIKDTSHAVDVPVWKNVALSNAKSRSDHE